jgi:catechol 2,3-dioxygenase-like lactoylglutathione lyase family enzyme
MSSDVLGATKLIVGDLERSAAFYREVCGLTEERRVSETIGGRAMCEIILASPAPDAARLVLFAFLDAPKPAGGEVILVFVTTDAQAFVERAARAGGSVMHPLETMPQHAAKVAFVRDPEGHLIEVLQRL